MKTVRLIPTYTPLTQQRLLCVPTCVQMVLLRRRLVPFDDAETIGQSLRLKVPKRFVNRFMNVRRTAKKPSGGFGTQDWDGALLKAYFRKRRIPLDVTFTPSSALPKEPRTCVLTNLRKRHDIMVTAYMTFLIRKRQWGHAMLIAAATDQSDPLLTLCDPSPIEKKFWTVRLSTIVRAMHKRFDGHERGVYVFSPR